MVAPVRARLQILGRQGVHPAGGQRLLGHLRRPERRARWNAVPGLGQEPVQVVAQGAQ